MVKRENNTNKETKYKLATLNMAKIYKFTQSYVQA